MKTVWDNLKHMLVERRKVNKLNANSSGIDEFISARDQFMDDHFLDREEAESARRRETQQATVIEYELFPALKHIQRNSDNKRNTVGDQESCILRATTIPKRKIKYYRDGWNDSNKKVVLKGRAS